MEPALSAFDPPLSVCLIGLLSENSRPGFGVRGSTLHQGFEAAKYLNRVEDTTSVVPNPWPESLKAQQQNNEIAGQINHETLGMKDSKTENESLASAEDKIAHVRLNGIKKWGSNEKAQKYASLVSAIENGSGYKISQQAVEQAIREDSKGIDPTHGAIFYNMRTVGQFKHGGRFQGQKIHTYSGPYISKGPYKYIMTYGP